MLLAKVHMLPAEVHVYTTGCYVGTDPRENYKDDEERQEDD